VVTVIGTVGEKPSVVVAVNDAARDVGLSAGTLVKTAARVLGGSGGGKDDVAQGGGTSAAAAPSALAEVERAVARQVSSS
jgi:alanyl-tRNA synthetase